MLEESPTQVHCRIWKLWDEIACRDGYTESPRDHDSDGSCYTNYVMEIKVKAFFEVELNVNYTYVSVVDAIACWHSNDNLLDPCGLHHTLEACEDGLSRVITSVETSIPGHAKSNERVDIWNNSRHIFCLDLCRHLLICIVWTSDQSGEVWHPALC